MLTCTWAPTTFQGTQLVDKGRHDSAIPRGKSLRDLVSGIAQNYEAMGLSHMLIAQRWWGSGEEIEASSLDCLAMTALFASCTDQLQLITAIHPGFFRPTTIAKWGATIDQISGGRWAINLTSGWNLQEFDMYGVDALSHDERYARSSEFIEVLRRAWQGDPLDYHGRYYQTNGLQLEPVPGGALQVYQGGQSDAAIAMAAQHSDWMFLNGGPLEKIEEIIERASSAARSHNRQLRFAIYAAPLCRATDADAWAEIEARLSRIDRNLAARRRQRVAGAQGMWASDDDLSLLDTNEGYAARLIGSPETVLRRIEDYRKIGVEMLHMDIRDTLFQQQVLPHLAAL